MAPSPTFTIGVLSGDANLPSDYGIDGQFSPEEAAAVQRVIDALEARGDYQVRHFGDHPRLFDELRQHPPDLALNFCDTGYFNRLHQEANIPALLELLEIPYTGASPAAMHRCNDKAMVRLLAAAHGIAVPNETFIDLHAAPRTRPTLYPSIIKPNAGCGSLGVTRDSVVHDAAEAEAYLEHLAAETNWQRALAQDFLTGPEYTVGLYGNPETGLTVLPPLEIDYSHLDPSLPPILTYGSKADPDSPYWQSLRFRRAELDEPIHAILIEHSIWLFERLGLRDYARIDYRSGADGIPRLLDANFNPTWNDDGKMAIMAGWAGHSYGDWLNLIIDAARSRYGLD